MPELLKKIDDHIPALPLNSQFGDIIMDALSHDKYKGKIKELIIEHTDSVTFMEKVQKYADKQIDARIFKSVKVVLGLVFGWVASIVIAVVIAWLKLK